MKDHICMKNIRAKIFQFTNPVLPVNNQLMDRGGGHLTIIVGTGVEHQFPKKSARWAGHLMKIDSHIIYFVW